MLNIADIRFGDKVHYKPPYYGEDRWENGKVKEIRSDVDDAIWVVFHCAGEWERFTEYTAAMTKIKDLYPGWRHG